MTSHLDDAVQAFGEAIGKLLSVSTIAVIVQPDLATAARSLIEDPNCSEDADWIPAIAAAAVKLLAVMQREGVDAQESARQVNNLLPDQMPPRSRPVSRRPKGVLMERKPFQWGASKRRPPELSAGLRKLNRAFGLMRDRGLVAEQNFMCCSSCGQRVMDEEMLPNHPDATGYCFYDSQSADTLVGRPSGLSDAVDLEGVGVVWLRHGAVNNDGSDERVGELVRACLQEAGISAAWNGKGDTCVVASILAPAPAAMLASLEERASRPAEELDNGE